MCRVCCSKLFNLQCTVCNIVMSIFAALLALVVIAMFLAFHKNVPLYCTDVGNFYEADGQTLSYEAAIRRCRCLINVYPTGNNAGIKFPYLELEKYFEYEDYEMEHQEMWLDKEQISVVNTTPPFKKHTTLTPPTGTANPNVTGGGGGGGGGGGEVAQEAPKEGVKPPRKRDLPIIEEFLPMVAVVRKAFLDDDTTLHFACTGFVFESNKVVASKPCIQSEKNRGKTLIARSEHHNRWPPVRFHNINGTSRNNCSDNLVSLTIFPEYEFKIPKSNCHRLQLLDFWDEWGFIMRS